MSDMVDIEWNNFLKICCEDYPEESCAFLFARTPFRLVEEWHVFPVDNVAQDKTKLWIPDKKQLQKVKKWAKVNGLTKIGNIHSHPLPKDFEDLSTSERERIIEHHNQPSDADLKYARKHNNIVKGILVVDDKGIYAHCFHDQFGEPLPDLYLNGINSREIVLDVIQ